MSHSESMQCFSLYLPVKEVDAEKERGRSMSMGHTESDLHLAKKLASDFNCLRAADSGW